MKTLFELSAICAFAFGLTATIAQAETLTLRYAPNIPEGETILDTLVANRDHERIVLDARPTAVFPVPA